jgi:hypothetical protein
MRLLALIELEARLVALRPRVATRPRAPALAAALPTGFAASHDEKLDPPVAPGGRREHFVLFDALNKRSLSLAPPSACDLRRARRRFGGNGPDQSAPAAPRNVGILKRLPVLFRATLYAFRGGFLIRPLLIVVALGTAGAILSAFEKQFPAMRWFVPRGCFPRKRTPKWRRPS